MLNADHPPNGAHGPTDPEGQPIVGAAAATYPDAAAATAEQSPPPRGAGLVA